MRRAAFWLAPPLVCLVVCWHAWNAWFLADDFAWLRLPLVARGPGGLTEALFTPKAQGTVRLFSERLFFLAGSSLFGLHALPFRIWIYLTQVANLTLASAIGARLTGSRAAGLIAALLWATHPVLAVTLSWASAYNQALCGFFLLAAFYSLLRYVETEQRKWWIAQWAAFVMGFGALEIIAVYPALAALYTLCRARRHFLRTLPLFIPSVLFAVARFFWIPKVESPIYAMAFDERLPVNFVRYLGWALGPSRMDELIAEAWRIPGLVVTALIGLGLGWFAWRRRNPLIVFCAGWFVLLLAPVVPLANHVSDYYLTLPVIGLCWMAGWALVTTRWRMSAALLAAVYAAGSVVEIESVTKWYRDRSGRMQALVEAVDRAHRRHPSHIILLMGVGNELFQSGFQDDPFQLVDVSRIYLAPGSEAGIKARTDLGGLARFQITSQEAMRALDRGEATVLAIAGDAVADVTRRYHAVARAQSPAENPSVVDVGNPMYASRLGPTWYPSENGFRWMPRTATVLIGGPTAGGQKLYVNGYAPAPLLAAGGVKLHFRAAAQELGSVTIRQPDQRFALQFPLPDALVGRDSMEIAIECSRVLKLPGDKRELGMIFGTFEIK